MLLFVACIVAADALVGERGLAQSIKARREFSRSTVELSAMRAENATLREDIRRLKEDRSTLEQVARGELGLLRRGEILVIVKDVPPAR
jgi:cell division protein FtsB